MTMLMKYDVFSEDVTRFYMAECILAIEAVHNLGYIHRSVEPSSSCFRFSFIFIVTLSRTTSSLIEMVI